MTRLMFIDHQDTQKPPPYHDIWHYDIYPGQSAFFKCTNGDFFEVFHDPYTESPRQWHDNLCEMYAWDKSYASPDDCIYDDPEDFMSQVLEDCWPEPSELVDKVISIPDSPFRIRIDKDDPDIVNFETYGHNMFISENFWSAECDWDAPDETGESLTKNADWSVYDIIAKWPDAPKLAQGRCVLKPLYKFEHSGVSYSTSSFQDPWDSGQVGFCYVSPDKLKDEYLAFGVSFVEALDRASEVVDGEVTEYDGWAKGLTYGCRHYDKQGHEIDSCGGFIERDNEPECHLIDEMADGLGIKIDEDLGEYPDLETMLDDHPASVAEPERNA